jgi:hypothetical protein
VHSSPSAVGVIAEAKAQIDLSGPAYGCFFARFGTSPRVQKGRLINRYRTDIPIGLGTGDLIKKGTRPMKSDHANARGAGFDSLMVKPITEESLRALVG